MSSTGSPKAPQPDAAPEPRPDTGDSPSTGPVLLLVIAAVLVIAALVIGVPVIGALYALVAPPEPPLPSGQTLMRSWVHSGGAGIEERLYGSTGDPCALLAFYETRGVCTLNVPEACAAQDAPALSRVEIAVCTGSALYSGFAQRWRAVIAAGYETPLPTRLRLAHQRVLDAQLAETPLP
jgi:hypothetical protein